MPEVISQLRWLTGDKARVHAGDQPVRRIRREEKLIEEIIRRPRDVEFAVLDVPPEIPAELETVFALLKRHQVAVAIDIFVKELRVPIVGPKSRGAIVKPDGRHARSRHIRIRAIENIPGLGFVDQVRAEGVHPARLKIGEMARRGVLETVNAAAGVRGPEAIGRVQPVVLSEDAVVLPLNPINAPRPLIPVEQIAHGLRAENQGVVVEERRVAGNQSHSPIRNQAGTCGRLCSRHTEQILERLRDVRKTSRVVAGTCVTGEVGTNESLHIRAVWAVIVPRTSRREIGVDLRSNRIRQGGGHRGAPFGRLRYDGCRRGSGDKAVALIGRREKEVVLPDRTCHRSAELVEVQGLPRYTLLVEEK